MSIRVHPWLAAASIAGAILIAGCKGREQAVAAPPAPSKPDWVLSRPITDVYYIGVSSSPKTRADFAESAKKSALNDLASEISVRVEGNSLLFTLDQKKSFDETFTSTINTRTSEQLEGFEQVDTWQDDREYWVYYRLSKSEHARIKTEKKRQAIGQATDGYMRSQQSLVLGDLKTAFDQAIRGLISMKEYWGENDLVTVGDRQVPIANELFAELQRMTNGVRLSALPERCDLSYGNGFKREMLISATFADIRTTRDLVQLPITLKYPGANGEVVEQKNTDTEGRLRTTVQRVMLGGVAPEILVRLNMDALVSKEHDPLFTRPLIASLTVPELHMPIDRTLPKVFVQSAETNMGSPLRDGGVATAIKEDLTSKGFRFADRAADADLLLTITANTREGGEASGFYTAFLDVGYVCKDRRTQETIAEGGKQGVKGIQLDYVKAGMDAYKKASQEVKKELANTIANGVL